MLTIHTLTLGSIEVNCYLVSGEPGRCAVIDPGFQPTDILAALEKLGWTAEAVLLTHKHFDHVGAADAVAKHFGCPIYLHRMDREMVFPMLFGKVGDTLEYDEGDTLRLAGLEFTVLHTPGHTPGGVCLRCGDALFTGDTLFAGSCGRVDFPGSSKKDMLASLRRLAALEENLTVYPGHGGASTLEEERNTNPYLFR